MTFPTHGQNCTPRQTLSSAAFVSPDLCLSTTTMRRTIATHTHPQTAAACLLQQQRAAAEGKAGSTGQATHDAGQGQATHVVEALDRILRLPADLGAEPAPEPGGSACYYWNGYRTQCIHPARERTPGAAAAARRS